MCLKLLKIVVDLGPPKRFNGTYDFFFFADLHFLKQVRAFMTGKIVVSGSTHSGNRGEHKPCLMTIRRNRLRPLLSEANPYYYI